MNHSTINLSSIKPLEKDGHWQMLLKCPHGLSFSHVLDVKNNDNSEVLRMWPGQGHVDRSHTYIQGALPLFKLIH